MKRLMNGAIIVSISIFLLSGCYLLDRRTFEVNSISMNPLIQEKDKVAVDTGFYKKNKVELGDIIIYEIDDMMNVKRVVGLPGEFLQLKDGQLLNDGEPKNKEYISNEISNEKLEEGITLGDDEYFILGDNLQYSKDSRHFGPIKKEKIVGKVVNIYSN